MQQYADISGVTAPIMRSTNIEFRCTEPRERHTCARTPLSLSLSRFCALEFNVSTPHDGCCDSRNICILLHLVGFLLTLNSRTLGWIRCNNYSLSFGRVNHTHTHTHTRTRTHTGSQSSTCKSVMQFFVECI